MLIEMREWMEECWVRWLPYCFVTCDRIRRGAGRNAWHYVPRFVTCDRASCTYIMQLTVAIHHTHPIAFNTAQAVVDAIYEGGAMFPFTPDADADAAEFPHTFLYPYHSEVSDLDDGICIGRLGDLCNM